MCEREREREITNAISSPRPPNTHAHNYTHPTSVKQCRVYRVRTIGYTVRYNHWGPKPHTRWLTPYPIDLCQIGNTIIIIFVNTYVEGGNVYQSLSIHSLLHIHWSIIHTNTFLINYSFISYYYILIQCRHSFTPQLTQTH